MTQAPSLQHQLASFDIAAHERAKMTYSYISLQNRPQGAPKQSDFRLQTAEMPTPQDGEILVKVDYMSLDPYMRGRMDDAKSYSAPIELGQKMEAGGVGQVIASKNDHINVGDHVFGMFGWASHACVSGKEVRKLDPSLAPITTALGVLGMPGFTGWYGLTQLAAPKSGETLVVAAATGPVGSMVGQLAKSMGLRVVGIAGGADKCAFACDVLGFDDCLDHSQYPDASSLRKALAQHCPQGIDIYFENVAGKVLLAVLPLMNVGGRIPVCGMISWYNAGALGANASHAQDMLPKLWRTILVNRLSVSGFIISDHWDQYPSFLKQVAPLVASGTITYKEDIVQGLEHAPQAFINLLNGGNFGKLIVQITP